MKVTPEEILIATKRAGSLALGEGIRQLFPIFESDSRPLSYLDTAASSQKPQIVIDRLSQYLSREHANIHRGAYALSAKATEAYDQARIKVAKFLGSKSEKSIIFTRGTTESINLVARSLEQNFKPGDSILLTLLEHHSNIVPWQLLAERKGLNIVWADILEDGSLNLQDYKSKILQHRPKLVACTHIANSMGTITPIVEMVAEAKKAGAWVLVDAAQSVAHASLNLAELGADFLAFSGHKLYGPTGIGVLYVREDCYPFMQPFQGGGDMISEVTVTGSTWAEAPQKFEAGTPAIAEAIALGTAIDFVSELGLANIRRHEDELCEWAIDKMRAQKGVTIYGPSTLGNPHSAIIPFNVSGVHAHDLSTIADSFNCQIRAGHHCAMPCLRRLGLHATARASLGVYSCRADIEALLEAIRKAQKVFA